MRASTRVVARGRHVPLDGFRGWVELITSSAVICRSVERSSQFVVDAAPSGIRSPLSLVLPGFRIGEVSLADEVVVERGRLRIGLAEIDVAAMPLWQPRLPNAVGVRELLALASVGTCASAPALDAAGGRVATVLAGVVAALEQQESLLDGTLGPDMDDAFDDVLGLALDATIGLGPGLTPSGDDALVGLLAVLGTTDQASALQRLRASMDQRLKGTTDYSGRLLQLAGLGEVHEGILDVLQAADDPRKLPAAVERLLTLGATSGADTFIGIAAGARFLVRSGPRRVTVQRHIVRTESRCGVNVALWPQSSQSSPSSWSAA